MTLQPFNYRRAISVFRSAATVATALVLAACGSAQRGAGEGAGQTGAVPRNAAIAIRFAGPLSIEVGDADASGEGASRRRVSGVLALSGRVHRVAGDSLWVALTTLTTAEGRESFPRRPEVITRIQQGPETRVEVLSAAPARSMGSPAASYWSPSARSWR